MSADYNPFDYVNSINLKNADYTQDEGYMRHYPAFMVNKALSYFIDTINYSTEKAEAALKLLNKEEIQVIRSKLNSGGMK